jgi:predicted transcriptional regulator
MPRKPQQAILGSLQQLSLALATNAAQLPTLEAQRQQFDQTVTATLEALARRAALRAEKQEVSRAAQALLTESYRQANILRLALKSLYGIRSEKLAEFGLKPLRSRKSSRSAKPDPEPAPEDPGSTIE